MATSLGPLTTSFSPPAGCLGSTITWQLPNPSATDSYFLQGRPSAASCFPGNYDPHTTASFAPGICPSAYTAVRNREGKPFSTSGVLTCCPTYALFEARNTSQNVPFMSTMACQSFFGQSGTFSATRMSGSVTVVAQVTYTASDVLNAYGIIIVPVTSTSTAQSSTSSSAAQSSTPATSQSPSQSASSSELSTGAKAGIGGGIAALALVLGLVGAWIFLARKRRRDTLGAHRIDEPPAYKDNTGPPYAHQMVVVESELSAGGEVRELPVGKEVRELPAGKQGHELPAGKQGHEAQTARGTYELP